MKTGVHVFIIYSFNTCLNKMYKLNHAKCVPYKQVILFPENIQIYHGSSISLCHSGVIVHQKTCVLAHWHQQSAYQIVMPCSHISFVAKILYNLMILNLSGVN